MKDRTKSKAIWGAVSLFALGVAVGVASHHLVAPRVSVAATPAERHDAALNDLQAKLHLEDEQMRRVDSVLRRHKEVLEQTWRTLHVRLQAAVDTVHEDIEALLHDEQKDEFRDWLAEMGGGRDDLHH